MKILVVGGCGFIGSHIVDTLLENGHFVRVYDNLVSGNMGNLSKYTDNKNFEFVCGDIRNAELFNKSCESIDAICHQSAIVSVEQSINDPILTHDVNVNGFLNVLNCAKNNGIKRFVYASSAAVYGDKCDNATENTIGNILSPYGLHKYINELYANMYTKLYGMECIGLRYFNVYGQRQNSNSAYASVICKFMESIKNNKSPIIYGNGDVVRDFVHVTDVANANLLALTIDNTECFGNVFNVGTGVQTTLMKLLLGLLEIMKSTHNSNAGIEFREERKGDIKKSYANVDNAYKYLGFKASVDIVDGLKMLL
ncbi:4,6-dehydratase 5-epimerase [Bodo saltans virus]|uniref:4,6-dehydratase 5-epimerase n=1 Tax=Bodo saltans virus TaxID=2024608 RepID=A0A2H4UUK0_9VIRU|nr:4,6-dehydratase 5-epimerase [Bodo saltans virus]ATZ80600.1 4,6-dehydratase 5-epimerase [Bodo saltans virus]